MCEMHEHKVHMSPRLHTSPKLRHGLTRSACDEFPLRPDEKARSTRQPMPPSLRPGEIARNWNSQLDEKQRLGYNKFSSTNPNRKYVLRGPRAVQRCLLRVIANIDLRPPRAVAKRYWGIEGDRVGLRYCTRWS